MKETEICETLANALISVYFHNGYTKPPLAKNKLNRSSVATLLHDIHDWCFYRKAPVIKAESDSAVKRADHISQRATEGCGSIKELQALGSYPLFKGVVRPDAQRGAGRPLNRTLLTVQFCLGYLIAFIIRLCDIINSK